jgi:D-methionine transport system permease protein
MFRKHFLEDLLKAFSDTVYVLLFSGILIIVIGFILGLLLFILNEHASSRLHKTFFQITSLILNIFRSIPFLILLIIMIPVTAVLVGTILGTKAAIPALVVSAAPFFARLVFASFNDIPRNTIEFLHSSGFSFFKRTKLLLKEALPSLINAITMTLVTLVGFIASAGAIGAGGLGQLAKNEGYRFNYTEMFISTSLILIIVFIVQISGDLINKTIDKRRKIK